MRGDQAGWAVCEVELRNSPSVPHLTVGSAMNNGIWRVVDRRFVVLASELDEIEQAYAAGEIDVEEVSARCEAVLDAIITLDIVIRLQMNVGESDPFPWHRHF